MSSADRPAFGQVVTVEIHSVYPPKRTECEEPEAAKPQIAKVHLCLPKKKSSQEPDLGFPEGSNLSAKKTSPLDGHLALAGLFLAKDLTFPIYLL